MNWMLFPTLGLAFALFGLGMGLWQRACSTRFKILLGVLSLVISLPGILMVVYYLHLFDSAAWFYEFRSLPLSDLTAAGSGLLAGMLAATPRKSRLGSVPFLVVILVLGISIPYVKGIFRPLLPGQFRDTWVDGVCLRFSMMGTLTWRSRRAGG